MADLPTPAPRRASSAAEQELRVLIERAEAVAIGFFVGGVLLLVIGLALMLIRGAGLTCLILGGISFLAGCIENVRAEVLRVRARLEKD